MSLVLVLRLWLENVCTKSWPIHHYVASNPLLLSDCNRVILQSPRCRRKIGTAIVEAIINGERICDFSRKKPVGLRQYACP